MHEQDLAIVKGLVSVAWADGHVTSEESEVIEALLQAFNATPSEVREIRNYASVARTVDDVPVTELSYDDRRLLLLHAVLLTEADGERSATESALLEQLCRKLRIPDLEAKGIIDAAERRAALLKTNA
ncbi:MAG TPA: TerB family tellurite resistance protein [Polyangiaceae bacterium]|jgi:prepilin-type processing-associated H-X9-DG protein|nr:TerB family tellurite resistance protein [Polyangiaceae bacterium]